MQFDLIKLYATKSRQTVECNGVTFFGRMLETQEMHAVNWEWDGIVVFTVDKLHCLQTILFTLDSTLKAAIFI